MGSHSETISSHGCHEIIRVVIGDPAEVPRLTNKQHLERHRALRKIWLEAQEFFGVLPYTQQMDAHIFYAPARDWSDGEMLQHRQKVQESDPSLPHRASKGYL